MSSIRLASGYVVTRERGLILAEHLQVGDHFMCRSSNRADPYWPEVTSVEHGSGEVRFYLSADETRFVYSVGHVMGPDSFRYFTATDFGYNVHDPESMDAMRAVQSIVADAQKLGSVLRSNSPRALLHALETVILSKSGRIYVAVVPNRTQAFLLGVLLSSLGIHWSAVTSRAFGSDSTASAILIDPSHSVGASNLGAPAQLATSNRLGASIQMRDAVAASRQVTTVGVNQSTPPYAWMNGFYVS